MGRGEAAYDRLGGVSGAGSVFPERLRTLRERQGISRRVLADLCEVSKSAIARYERGEQEPTVSAVCRMADYLGVSTDVLLGRTENF